MIKTLVSERRKGFDYEASQKGHSLNFPRFADYIALRHTLASQLEIWIANKGIALRQTVYEQRDLRQQMITIYLDISLLTCCVTEDHFPSDFTS